MNRTEKQTINFETRKNRTGTKSSRRKYKKNLIETTKSEELKKKRRQYRKQRQKRKKNQFRLKKETRKTGENQKKS